MNPCVGNDVVDLAHPDAQASVPDGAFARRVCTPRERAALATASEPRRALWRLWAAKEAAFKALSRRNAELSFRHAAFEVEDGAVHHAGERLDATWFDEDDVVACVVARGARRLVHAGAQLASGSTPAEESWAARELARTLIGELLDVDPAAISVQRPPFGRHPAGPPVAYIDDRPLQGVVLSLAHHGRRVACVVAVG